MSEAAPKQLMLCKALILLLVPALTLATNYIVNTSSDNIATGSGDNGSLPYVIDRINNVTGTATNNISFDTTAIGGPINLNSVNLQVLTKQATLTTTNPVQTQIISGTNTSRLLGTTASLDLTNISLQNGLAQGGSGGNNAGGGGLGAGGGIFISGGSSPGTITLRNSSITGCTARGGTGGNGLITGGNGGAASFGSLTVTTGAGYGGGSGGTGFNGGNVSGGAGGGTGAGGAGGNNGIPGAGGYCGGGGGASNTFNGGNLLAGGGGGNGGGAAGGAGAGAGGGYGVGGSGGTSTGSGAGGGGFGGGGGGALSVVGAGSATNSNYSGGSGAPTSLGTTAAGGGGGGFGAGGGGGGSGSAGGGGSGLGGGIFVGDGATLIINDASGTATDISGNFGQGGGTATSVAPGVFLFKGASIQFTSSVNTPVNFAIQCDPGATGSNKDNGVTVNLNNIATTLTLNNAGTNFQGPFTITRGTLNSVGANLPGSSISTPGTMSLSANSIFNLTSGTFPTNTIITNVGTINLAGAFAPASTSTNTTTGIININTGGSFTQPVTFTYTGTINVNRNGNPFGSAVTGGVGSVLNIGQSGAVTANTTNPISSVTTISVQNSGTSFTVGAAISAVTTFTTAAGTRTTLNSTLSSGTITNPGDIIATVANPITTSGAFSNSGGLYVSNTFSTTSINTFTNNGSVNVYGPNGALGTYNNGAGSTGILNFGRDISGGLFANTNNVTGPVTNTPAIRVYAGTMNTSGSGTISGVNGVAGLTVDASAAATFGASYSGSGPVSNSGIMTISNAFGTGAITNTSTGTLVLSSGANTISSNITNNIGGVLNINSASTTTGAIINNATMHVNAQLSGSSSITNNGALTIGANMVLTGQPLTSTSGTSSVTVSGQRTLTASSYTNSDVHNTTITSAIVYDRLDVTGNVNLDNSFIDVTVPPSLQGSWTIITGTGTFSAVGVFVNLPNTGGGLFSGWGYTVGSNFISVQSVSSSYQDLASGTVNKEIAAVLDQMAAHITNSGQQQLINAINLSATVQQFNNALQQLRPNTNSSTPSIAMQSAIFSKVEQRIASLENAIPTNLTSYTAGDINAHSSMWIGGFGSFGRLSQNNENFGYRARAFGAIVGIDTTMSSGGVFGFGFALSKTIVHEYVNPNCTTSIIGYHALAYGTDVRNNNTFLEWLGTGAITNNDGSRAVHVNGVVMSTTGSYRGYQGSFRLNYGMNFDFFDQIFTVSPLTTTQYTLLYQPDYSEAYSPAALNISPTNYQSVLTIGAGTRLSFPCDDWWLVGTREVRALVTYDAISSNNNVVSSFLVGSSTFSITNTAVPRLAFRTGIDLSFSIFSCLQLQLSFDYELRHKYTDYSASSKLKFLF